MKSKALAVLSLGVAFSISGCYSLGADVVERDETGQVTAPAELGAMNIGVGDCANYPKEHTDASEEEGYSFSEITVVPCSGEHELEAYAKTDLPDGEFPGDSELVAQADEFCYGEFPGFVGTEYEESSLYFDFFMPTKESWGFDGDREILCLITGEEGELLTGSMKGTGR